MIKKKQKKNSLMQIDKHRQWECRTLCAIKMKASPGRGKKRHVWPRLVQEAAESKTSFTS